MRCSPGTRRVLQAEYRVHRSAPLRPHCGCCLVRSVALRLYACARAQRRHPCRRARPRRPTSATPTRPRAPQPSRRRAGRTSPTRRVRADAPPRPAPPDPSPFPAPLPFPLAPTAAAHSTYSVGPSAGGVTHCARGGSTARWPGHSHGCCGNCEVPGSTVLALHWRVPPWYPSESACLSGNSMVPAHSRTRTVRTHCGVGCGVLAGVSTCT